MVENNRSTTLAKGNTRVHTVEHVLATFAGYGIDNAIVELDSNEPPIADGSAREYCKMVQEAGIVPQEERREAYFITEPIELEMGETVMTLFPDEGFKLSCTSSDRNGRFTQFYSVELSPKTWEKELAHARTFCFYEEIARRSQVVYAAFPSICTKYSAISSLKHPKVHTCFRGVYRVEEFADVF